jgi:transposase
MASSTEATRGSKSHTSGKTTFRGQTNSPEMNPIEKACCKLKAFLRKIAERTVAGLMRALENCVECKLFQCLRI